MRDHDVVIVGGGPTGLMLAGELALAGVDVVVVERRATREVPGRQAGGLHARTLELLDQRGIVDRFLLEGQRYASVGFHVPLDLGDFPTRHNYVLALPQERTERLLGDWLDELGAPVLRGREVAGFDQDGCSVTVSLADGERLRAGWLVGCDGGRSGIRKSAGIAFPGWDASTRWLLAEVRMSEPPQLGIREDEAGRHAMVLREDGETVGVVLAGRDPHTTAEPSLIELADALRAIYGTDFGVHAPRWLSHFTDASRQAATYRDRRVLLAGDAAHIHPPMGGQGLNLGIQDAVNLGWKLARVVDGTAPETLLDTYQAECHPVAARVLRNTVAQGVLRSPGDRMAVLGGFVAEMLAMAEPRKHFAAMISGLGIRYDLGGEHPLVGRRMPDLDIVTAGGPTRIYALLHEARALLLDFGKTGSLPINGWVDRVMRIDATFDGRCELPAIGVVPMPAAVLIRPDGHVAWVGRGDATGLSGALTTWLGKASVGAERVLA